MSNRNSKWPIQVLHVVPPAAQGTGAVTAAEISDMLGVSRTYTFKILKNLVRDGLVIEYEGSPREYLLLPTGENYYLNHVRKAS